MKRFAILFAAIALAVSCLDGPEPFLFRIITMGYPQEDGSFLADDGVMFVFPAEGAPDWQGAPRVLAQIDAVKAVADSTYEARLLAFSKPLYKKPVVVEGDVPDSLGWDPVRVVNAWYSGGCFNLAGVVNVIQESGGKHIINLMFDRNRPSEDTLHFVLKHLDTMPPESEDAEYTVLSFYASFPLDGLMPAKDSTVLEVSWTWDGESKSSSGKVKI